MSKLKTIVLLPVPRPRLPRTRRGPKYDSSNSSAIAESYAPFFWLPFPIDSQALSLLQIMLSKIACIFFSLAVLLSSCQRTLATGKSRFSFKITRLQAKNINASPSIFGIVYSKDNTGVHQWPGPIVRVDEKLFLYAKNNGSYEYSLTSGQHEIIAGQVGYSKVEINSLFLQKGDSVRIDFLLRVDNNAHLY